LEDMERIGGRRREEKEKDAWERKGREDEKNMVGDERVVPSSASRTEGAGIGMTALW
jgi:hypothetical protein